MNGSVRQSEWVCQRSDGCRYDRVCAHADHTRESPREHDEGKADHERDQCRHADCAGHGVSCVIERGLDYRSGRGRGHAVAVKVPLRYGGCRRGALYTRNDRQSPEVVQKECNTDPPRACVDDPSGLVASKVAAKEQPREHEDPNPRPEYHGS